MPNWAGKETGGERIARWSASACAKDCFAPVEFHVTADGDHEWEGFACGDHLASLVQYVNFRGRHAQVGYFGPVSSNARARMVLDTIAENREDHAEQRDYLEYFTERMSEAYERANNEKLTDRTRAKWRKLLDGCAVEAGKRLYGTAPVCSWVVRHATTETPDEHCDLLVEVGDEYCPGHQSKADAMAEQERAEQEPEGATRQAERDKAAEATGDEVRVLQLMNESGYTTPCGYSAAHSGSFEPVPATQIINCGPAVGDVPACDACAALYARLSGKGE